MKSRHNLPPGTLRFGLALLVSLGSVAASLGQGPGGDAADEAPVLVRSFTAVETPSPPFENGEFAVESGETIAFLGGTNTFDQQRHAHLETRFHLAWPKHRLRFRNLAWQGDTLYHQARPRYFYTVEGDPQPGSSPDNRERIEPGIVFLDFGKVESLDGRESLPRFIAAYAELLDRLQTRTNRLVLVLPTPFFPVGPAADLAKSRNVVLGEFAAAMRGLAEERGLVVVDTFSPLLQSLDPALSSNGIHLTETGHAKVAAIIADQLEIPAGAESEADPAIGQSLDQSIQRKNRLWQQYYRPTNWAFLFGDRQHVPASRDHVDTSKRWLVDEIGSLPPLIAETEADIHRYAAEASAPSPR
ncbi:MAG: GDSL-type esterase/lipase family protein [Verrucomicrobiales bacterium]